MGHRSFRQRRFDRAERLLYRAEFLERRIAQEPEAVRSHDKQERSALLWALEEIGRLDEIENILDDASLSEGQRVLMIGAVCESRYRPTDDDVARTRQLQRLYGQ
jgi:hypothetical protein